MLCQNSVHVVLFLKKRKGYRHNNTNLIKKFADENASVFSTQNILRGKQMLVYYRNKNIVTGSGSSRLTSVKALHSMISIEIAY